jgi:ATP-dependent Clp protease ATP-binding subunit ClpC
MTDDEVHKTASSSDGLGKPPTNTRVGLTHGERSKGVIELAQIEARRLGHNFVGTEQLLSGLLQEGTGLAARALRAKGVRASDVRNEIEKIIGRGSGFVAVEVPFTPRTKRALELSAKQARDLGDNFIDTEHLLLGLLDEGYGVAICVLEKLGTTPEALRQEVLELRRASRVGDNDSADGAEKLCDP